jgi:Na+-translocating ferredoxin:NAD+ oxidoreductase RNF subunit RnfB
MYKMRVVLPAKGPLQRSNYVSSATNAHPTLLTSKGPDTKSSSEVPRVAQVGSALPGEIKSCDCCAVLAEATANAIATTNARILRLKKGREKTMERVAKILIPNGPPPVKIRLKKPRNEVRYNNTCVKS